MREKRRRSGNLYCAESSLFYRSTACRLRYLVKFGYRGFLWTLPVGRHGRRVHASMQYRRRVRRGEPRRSQAAAALRPSAPSEAAGGPHNRHKTIMRTRDVTGEHDDSIDVRRPHRV